jgi:TRAP-type C4-dicarboxylate transport system permease small subunit
VAPPSGSSSKSWFDLLIDALAVLAAALIVLLTVLIVVDVALRAPRLFTIPWSLEAAEYMLYAITFLGAPWVLREEGHIAIELVVELLPPGLQRGVQRLADLIGAVVCGVLFVYACRVMWRSWQGGVMVRKSFSFPEWVVFAGVPLVMLILLGIYLRWIVRPHAGPGRQLRRGL